MFNKYYLADLNFVNIYLIEMKEHIPRILQSIIAIPLIILTIINWNNNQMGQDVINITTVLIYLIGLDHIIIIYRWIINEQSIQYEATFIITSLVILGKLFEQYHPTENASTGFNQFCYANILVVLGVNIISLGLIIATIFAYMVRQIYRLMTQSLLTSNQNIQRQELDELLNMRKKFNIIKNENPAVNVTCAICLSEFEDQSFCIMLPVCEHCFHYDCIEGWLESKSTCPYCRNNIRLSLM